MMATKVGTCMDVPSHESQAKLYSLTYLDWQREGEFTLDIQRAKLLNQLTQILENLEQTPSDNTSEQIILGNQTVIVDDISRISPDLHTKLIDHIKKEKLFIGTWYSQVESLLTSGEAHIRSLLLGRTFAERHQLPVSHLAFLPTIKQSGAQLPQILHGFDIDTAFLAFGQSIISLPIIWQAPDGSKVFFISYPYYENPEKAVQHQRQAQPDGAFLWLQSLSSDDNIHLDEQSNISIKHSTLKDYAKNTRQYLPDEAWPKLIGELNLQVAGDYSGRFSSHIPHKQKVFQLVAQLNHVAEPFLALAAAFGTLKTTDVQKALLNYSWKLLLQNISPITLAGAVNDAVYDEMLIRNRRIEDTSKAVIDTALDDLLGASRTTSSSRTSISETYITVWNTLGHNVKQVVRAKLNLPATKYPNVLLDPDDQEIPFSWDTAQNSLHFQATVPSVGYAVYTLKISYDPTAEYNQARSTTNQTIGLASGETLTLNDNQLDWSLDDYEINNLLSYHDGGDAGSIWAYQEPQPDIIVQATATDSIQTIITPVYEQLIYRNRLRIAPSLTDGKSRLRGLKVLDLTTTATIYNEQVGIHFQTRFTNTAQDHRLRAHIRTGISATHVYADTAFALSPRLLPNNQPTDEQAMQSFVTLQGSERGIGLFTRGLTAFEPLQEDNQTSLALTLLRSVAYFDKNKKLRSNSAQILQDCMTEFMLIPLELQQDIAQIWQASLNYHAPLRAFQIDEKPAQSRHNYLSVESDKILMTALKPPVNSEGVIVRLLNVSSEQVDCKLKPSMQLTKASLVNLAEDYQSDVSTEAQNVVITIMPQQIVTLRLEF